MSTSRFTTDTVQKIKSAHHTIILHEINIGQTNHRNELVFFIKPELFAISDEQKIFNSLKMIEDKFTQYEVNVSGAAIIPGKVLDEFGIMNRHYGYISQLSRKASQLVDTETLKIISNMLSKEVTADYQILGGHEFLLRFEADVHTLSDIWFSQQANKLRSGFYFIEDTYQGKPIILVNGFHPSQLQHFTRDDHCILLMLLHSDTDWKTLKFDLAGDTFPERAISGSIRGSLFADPDFYGQSDVGINTNGVHLSAGPFEAAFEVVNFFSPITGMDPAITLPLTIEKTVESGVSTFQALSLLENPIIEKSDLFSLTENMNTKEAVNFAKNHLFS